MNKNPLIEWTQDRACKEFGINPKTLSGRLTRAGIPGTRKGMKFVFTTKEIATAIFGDLELARIRETLAKAEEVEKRNAESDGTLVDIDDFCRAYETIAVEMVRIIRTAGLSETAEDALLTKLSEAHKTK